MDSASIGNIVLNVVSCIGILVLGWCPMESKRSNKITIFTALIVLALNITIALLADAYITDLSIYHLSLISCAVVALIAYFFLSKDTVWQTLFEFFIQGNAFLIIMYSSKALAYYFVNNNVWFELFIRAIAFGCVFVIYKFWFRKIFRFLANNNKDNAAWGIMTTIVFIFAVLFYLILYYPEPFYKKDLYENLIMIVSISLIILIYLGIISILSTLVENNKLKMESEKNNMKISYWKTQIEMQKASIEKTKRIRHDLRHHINVIFGMFVKKDYDGAEKYLEELGAKVDNIATATYCQNYTVNCLLTLYIQRAIDLGIDVNYQINIPENINIDEMDLASLMANLIENATEGCQSLKKPKAKKFINIVTQYQTGSLRIMVENSSNDNLVFNGALPVSTKSKEGGIGTASIQDIATKYKGMVDFSQEAGIFKARVILNF